MSEPTAGRELDALIAEQVMGLVAICIDPIQRASTCLFDDDTVVPRIAPYSTDIAAAWTVVERLRADRWTLTLHYEMGHSNQWVADFNEDSDDPDFIGAYSGEALGDTAPLAICRAALAAIRETAT